MPITVHPKVLGSFYWSVDGSNLVLKNLIDTERNFWAIDPKLIYDLSGNKSSTFSQSQLDSNFKFTTSSDITVLAENFADSVWSAKGWTVNDNATFTEELKTFIANNYGQQSVNLNLQDLVVVISRGNISGTVYSIPFCFVGDIGDPTFAGNYSSVVLADNPFVYWRFEETSGTAISDSSGNNQNGVWVPTGGGLLDQVGAIDKCIYFDNYNSYIYSNNTIYTELDLTLEAWIKTSDASDASGCIMSFDGDQTPISGSFTPSLYVNDYGNLSYYHYAPGIFFLNSTKTVTDGNWHHVVATHSVANGTKLYIDGVLENSDIYKNTIYNFNAYFKVGSSKLGGYFNGYIDEVAFYKHELSATQIALHYASK